MPAEHGLRLHHRRRGSKVARVAVARRLLTLAYYALGSENGCRSFRSNQPLWSRRARLLSWPPLTAANLIEPHGPNHTMSIPLE